MRAFTRVAELRSFTKAAESLGLPKATVSAQVRQLEGEVGAQLLHRTTRRIRLTDEGESFYERAKDVLADIDELENLFRSEPSRITGRIRVDMASRMARLYVIPRLADFLERYPHVDIELGASDRRVDLVQEGYDCVIRGGELPDSSLVGRLIGEARVTAVASREYLQRYGTPRSLRDLRDHHVVHYVSSFGERVPAFEYLEGGRLRSISMKSRVTVNSAESYASACEAGLGIIQSPLASLRESIRSGRLVEILPRYTTKPIPIYILHPHRRNLPRRVRVFIEWVQAIMAGTYR